MMIIVSKSDRTDRRETEIAVRLRSLALWHDQKQLAQIPLVFLPVWKRKVREFGGAKYGVQSLRVGAAKFGVQILRVGGAMFGSQRRGSGLRLLASCYSGC